MLVVFLLVSPKVIGTLLSQPDWFDCASYMTTTENCNSGVPTMLLDFRGYPSNKWYSCSISRGSAVDTCCGYSQVSNNERCIEFQVILDPGTQGFIFEIPLNNEPEWTDDKQNTPGAPGSTGAGPAENFQYRINCEPGLFQATEPVCVDDLMNFDINNDTLFVTLCKPGGNANVYRIKALQGDLNAGSLIIQQGLCGGDVSIQAQDIDISTINWSSTDHPSYDAFLNITSGDTVVTVTVPNGDPLTHATWISGVPYLSYEVCGEVIGYSTCSSLQPVCATAQVAVIRPPAITAIDVTVCPEDPYYVEVTHANPSVFDYWWYDGSSASGTPVNSPAPTNDWNWTFSTPGTKTVVYRDPTVASLGLDPDCTRDTLQVTINLFPLPPANITGPALICVDGSYTFSTPSVSSADYFWEFEEYPAGTPISIPGSVADDRQPTVTFTTCGDKLARVTVTSGDGCDSTITRVFQSDSIPPDVSGCSLPNPTVDCGGTAQNQTNIINWHNANLAMLTDGPGTCVVDDCSWTVTSDFDLGNFQLDPMCGSTTAGSITVMYTLNDGCQTSTISATYTIEDMTPPVVNDPMLDDMSFECVGAIPEPDTNFVVVEVCGTVSRVWISDVRSGNSCSSTVVRTYRVTDACGNFTDFLQTFTISDQTAPVITCPAAITGNGCDVSDVEMVSGLPYVDVNLSLPMVIDSATFVALGPGASVSDNCGIERISYVDAINQQTCPLIITRTFTVRDSCGATATCTQQIIVEDQVNPEITAPDDINTEGCVLADIGTLSGLPYSPDTSSNIASQFLTLTPGTPYVFDSCGISTIVYIDALVENSCTYTVTRTFVVRDLCGRRSFDVQVISITDLTPPMITAPNDILDNGCTTLDVDGLSGLAFSTTTVVISPATFLGLPGGGLALSDNCGVEYVEYIDVLQPVTCPTVVEVLRTFTAYDSCMNMAMDQQIIALQDTTSPTVNCGLISDLILQCDQDYDAEINQWISDMTALLAADAMDDCVNFTVTDDWDGSYPTLDCPGTDGLTVTFTVADDCNNQVTCQAEIIIIDDTPPNVDCSVLEDLVLDCDHDYLMEIQEWIDSMEQRLLNATIDACGDTLIASNDWDGSTVPALSCDGSTGITITFTIEDRCGNSNQCTADVIVQDNTPPTVDCSALSGTVVQCWDELIFIITTDSLLLTDEITGIVTDDCWDDFTISISPIPPADNCPNDNISITYTITDPCGNSTDCEVIYEIDNPGPTIDVCPVPESYMCYADLLAEVLEDSLELVNGGVSTSCGMPYSVEVGVIPTITTCPTDVTVIFTVRDSCDRTDSCPVTYSFIEEAPQITCPANITVEGCSLDTLDQLTPWPYSPTSTSLTTMEYNDSDGPGGVEATDNCGVADITYRDDVTLTPCEIYVRRVFTVYDSCGLADSCDQIIILQNLGGPTIACPTGSVQECYLDLEAQVMADSQFIMDNSITTCNIEFSLQITMPVVESSCPGTYTVEYLITDSCGRTDMCTVDYTIDNSMSLTCPPGETVECWSDLLVEVAADSADIADPTAGFINIPCDITYTVEVRLPSANSCPGVYTVEYVVEDSCGRRDSCLVDYTVDNSLVLTCPPGETVECWDDLLVEVTNDSAAIADPLSGFVTISCDIGYTVEVRLPTPNSCPDIYSVEYVIQDSCGRRDSCTVDYNIDNALSVTCPSGETVECWDNLLVEVTADSSAIADPTSGLVSISCDIGYFVEVRLPTPNSCAGTYTVEYVVEDSCGRRDSCLVDYVIDNSLSMNCPSGETVECWDEVLVEVALDSSAIADPTSGLVSFSCDIGYTVEVRLPVPNACPDVYTVEYVVEDSCGRRDSCTVDYTVANTLTLVCPPGETVQCWDEVLVEVALDSAAIADPSSGLVSISCDIGYTVEVRLPVANACPDTYTVEYVVADSCGRRDSCLVDYIVVNSMSLSCPAGETVTCWDDILAEVALDSAAIADPTNGFVSITCDIGYTVEVRLPTPNACPGTYTVEFVVADSCGRRDSCTVDYVVDNALLLTCPAGETVECWVDLLTEVANDSASIADPTSGLVGITCDIGYTVEVRLPTPNSCPGVYTVEFVIQDSCGRRDSCLVDYTVENTFALSCPVGETIECWDDLLAEVALDSSTIADPLGGAVTVSCDIGYTVEVRLPEPNSCPGVYSVEFVIQDSCGRRDSCFVDYTIENNLALTCPAGVTIECWDNLLAEVTADSTSIADPTSGLVSISCDIGYFVEVRLPEPNSCPGIYSVEFIVEDSCGRRDSCFVDYTIDNSLALTCPAGETVECWDNLLAEVSLDSASIADPTSGLVSISCNIGYTVEVRLPEAAACPATYTVEYVVIDSCGRRDSCTVDYVIANTLTLICPPGETVECWDDVLVEVANDSAAIADPTSGLVTISCDIGYAVEVRLPTANACPDTYTVEYVVIDSCGRRDSCMVDYVVANTMTLVCPPGETVQCWDEVLAEVATDSAAIADPTSGLVSISCDIGYTVEVRLPVANACPGIYTVEFVVADSCGRRDSCLVDYTVQNSLSLTCPAGETVECWSDLLTEVANDSADIADPTNGFVSISCDIGYTVEVRLPTANACPGTYTVEFVVADSCGRRDSCTVDYIVENTLSLTCPSGETVECWTDLLAEVANDSTSIADPTSGLVSITCEIGYTVEVRLPEPNSCPGIYSVEYIIEDSCGRRDSCFVDYTIENTLTLTCPPGETVECWSDLLAEVAADSSAVADPTSGFVSISCDIGYTVEVRLPEPNSCPGSYMVEYIVEDSCGRRDSCFVDYLIENTLVLSCPSGETVQCWDNLLAEVSVDSASIADPASGFVSISCNIGYFVEVRLPEANSCPGIYSVEFIVEDSCGRRDSCFVDYTIDNALSMSCPAGETVECWDDVLVEVALDSAAIADPTSGLVSIACDIGYTVEVRLPVADACPDVYTVEFVVIDSCGRRDSCTVDYTVANTLSLVCPVGETVQCWEDVLAEVALDSAAIADPTSGLVSISCDIGYSVEVRLPIANACPGVYTVEYVVADSCGRRDSCTVDYSVDNAMSLSCPAGETVECWEDVLVEVAADSAAIADPTSGLVSITCDIGYTVEVRLPIPNACPGTYSVEFVVADSCGRRDSCIVDYIVENTLALTCPSGETVECWIDLLAVVSNDSASIVDPNSGLVAISCDIGYTVEVRLPSANSCPGIYTVEYVIQDSCGRRDSCLVDYTIENILTLSCPAGETVECWDDLLTEVALDSATIADPLGGAVGVSCEIGYTVEVRLPEANSCPGIYSVEFIVEDSCGRRDSCFVDYTIENTLTLTCPAGETVECWDNLVAEVSADSSSIANPGSGLVSISCNIGYFVEVRLPEPNSCPGIYSVEFIVQDSCGRRDSCFVDYTIGNTLSLTCPAGETVECWDNLLVEVALDSASISDPTSGLVAVSCAIGYAVEVRLPEAEACPGIYTVEFVVIDSCGRRDSCLVDYTIANALTLVCPVGETVQCWDELLVEVALDSGAIADPTSGLVGVSCNIGYTVEVRLPAADACPGIYTVEYVVADSCGRRDSCTVDYIIENTLTLTCPAGETVECWEDLLSEVALDSAAIADPTSGLVSIACQIGYTVEVRLPQANACPDTYTVEFVVADSCGRRDSCTIDYIVTNTLLVSCPPGQTVECWTDLLDQVSNDSALIADPGNGFVSLSCGIGYTVETYLPTTSNCPGLYEVIYVVTDSCGRLDSCSVEYSIENELPTIICPPDALVDCGTSIDTTILGSATASASCNLDYSIEYRDSIIPGECATEFAVARIWSVTDDCGRTSSCIQMIQVQDTVPPVLDGVPNDIVVPCDMIPDAAQIGTDITATDNCSEVEIIFTEDSIPGVCENTYDLLRTWTATDSCGNVFSLTQTITVEGCVPEVSISINPNPVCLDEDVVFDATIIGNYENPVYRWQHLHSLGIWVDVPGGTTVPFTFENVGTENAGYYRLLIADNVGNLSDEDCNVVSDSIELIINLPATTRLNQQICDEQTYNFQGTDLDEAGTYVDTLLTANGCDSIVILELEVLDVLTTDLRDTICEGQLYNFNGNITGSAGRYTAALISENGCDSIVTLDLVVLDVTSETLDVEICDGEQYDLNGRILTTSGTYIDTISNVGGCDSIITLNLIVNPVYSITLNEEICEGSVFDFHGSPLDSTGVYVDTLQTVSGCDSIVTLNLVVRSEYTIIEDVQICEGQVYDFFGTTLDESGTYTQTFQTVHGCDSTITVNLQVLTVLSTFLSDTICENDTYLFGGLALNTTGIYVDSLVSDNGCDSVVTLDLTVLPILTEVITVEICEGETFDFNGTPLSSAGTYNDNLISSLGCDSLVSLTLIVNTNYEEAITAEICADEVFTFHGRDLDSSGIYSDTLVSSSGCDSIVTLTLEVHPVYMDTINAQICDGSSYMFDGQSITVAGTYVSMLQSVNGCDSITTLNLEVLDVLRTDLIETICEGETYNANGFNETATGVYSDTLLSTIGCDSIVTLNLTVLTVATVELNIEICDDEIYVFNGDTLSSSGQFIDTISGSNGCDSIVTVNLVVHPSTASSMSVEICEGESYSFHGTSLDTTGIYHDTLSTIYGCDSVVTLDLVVHPVYDTTVYAQTCEGTPYDFLGQSLTDAGTYMQVLQSINGCDSMVTLELEVLETLQTVIDAIICEGESYNENGFNESTTGTYTQTLVSTIGCDSVVTLNLDVLPNTSENITVEICEGEYFIFDGDSLTASGNYTATFTGANTCDSIVTLDLIVHTAGTSSLTAAICEGEIYNFNGVSLDTTGTYFDTLSTIHGCDSVVTLDLVVYPVYDTTIYVQTCDGTPYNFLGQDLTTPGTYVETLQSINGCDSTVTLELEVLEILTTDLVVTICEGESYTENGFDESTTGVYTQTLTSVIGCDSVVTLDLTVLLATSETISAEICEGEFFNFNGDSISIAGSYVDTVLGSNGCDSVITLDLIVHTVGSSSISAEICDGESYNFHGKTLDTTGIYVDTISTSNGCDSIVTLDLTVYPVYDTIINAQTCEGTPYDFHGQMLLVAGSYVDVLQSVSGCDSTVHLELEILEVLSTEINASICEGETYSENGFNESVSGTYTQTLVSMIGCDSVVTLNLEVLPIQTEMLVQEICDGEFFFFNGDSLRSAGTYIDTVQGSNGCDSIVTLDLIIRPSVTMEISGEICEGDLYDFHGMMLDTSGIYQDTLQTIYGCDSVVILTLEVHPVYNQEFDAIICEGRAYTFNGTQITEAGTYTDVLQTVNGCDSIRTVHLSVLPIIREDLSIAICADETFDFNGEILSVSGTYTDTLVSTTGCDSVVFLDLTVHDLQFTDLDVDICEGELYIFQGDTLTTSGVFVDTLQTIHGCDSIITLDLDVHPTYMVPLDFTICEGESVMVAGVEYTASGTYQDTLQTVNGCDSVLVISLDVREIRYTSISATICDDIAYDFNGTVLTTTGTYVDTLVSSLGCDSVVTLDLQVRNVSRTSFIKQVCLEQTYNFNGEILDVTGIYSDTLTNATGCDSIVTVDFRVVETIEVDIFDTICEFDFITINGKDYDTAGMYEDTLQSVGGCDSVMHINIYVAPIEYTSLQETICEGEVYDFVGTPLTESGIYNDTLSSRFGCDSILELDLTVVPTIHTDLIESICEGEVFAVGDDNFNSSGSYDITLTSEVTGCDSIVHLDLTVIPTARYMETVTICAGESYMFNGMSYDSTGVYSDTLTSAAGCDSIATLDLYVHPQSTATVMFNLCTGEVASIDGIDYDMDTTLVVSYPDIYGCDSIVTYEITILPIIELIGTNVDICEGESVELPLTVTGTESPMLIWSPNTGLSCDNCVNPIATPDQTTTYTVSTVGCGGDLVETTITVTVLPYPGLTVGEDQTVNLGQTVELNATNAEATIPINWYDDDTGDLICTDCPRTGVRPDAPGEYHYRATSVNALGCGEEQVTTITIVDPCEIGKIEAANAFTPNGDGFNDGFEIRNEGVSTITLVQVFNRWGEMVFETSNINDQWDGTFHGEPVNPGVYMYIMEGICVSAEDFILTGNVTVIR